MLVMRERIQQDVVDKSNENVRMSSARVQVSVVGRHVILTGTVPTHAAYRSVIRDAWALPSVSAIVDRLALGCSRVDDPSDSRIKLDVQHVPSTNSNVKVLDPDQALAEQIIRALEQTDCFELDPCAIEPVVSDGTVTLEGIVPSWAAVRAALNAARQTPGVIRLRNEILLGP